METAVSNALGILSAAQSFSGNMRSMREDEKKRLYDVQYNQHLKGFQENPEYKPDTNASGYDAKAYNKAAVAHAQRLSQDEGVKAQRFANLNAEMKQKRAALMEIGQKAESIAVTNPQAAVSAYMTGYSQQPNGVDVQYNNETGMWDFNDNISGQSWSQEVTLDEARQTFQATMSKGEYEKIYLTDRTRVKRYNQAAMTSPDVLEDKDGNVLFRADLIDKNTGEKRTHYWGKDGNVYEMTPDQLKQGGFRLREDNQKERLAALGIEKEESVVALNKEKAKTERSHQAYYDRSPAGTSSDKEIKILAAMKKAYPDLSDAQIMDLYRSDKSYDKRLTALEKYRQDEMLDLEKPEDKKKYDQFAADLGITNPPGTEGYGLGGGQPPQKYPAGTAANPDPLGIR